MSGNYLCHLVFWVVPILALQWAVGRAIFLRNWRVLAGPTLIGGSYFSLCDVVAVRSGIWHFDRSQILGWHVGPLPVEEILFFFLTSLLVAQSLVLFLPDRFRW
ncbi:MAG: lycopene cyclase domain-containing protein [Verrucomicrobiota bacterium]